LLEVPNKTIRKRLPLSILKRRKTPNGKEINKKYRLRETLCLGAFVANKNK